MSTLDFTKVHRPGWRRGDSYQTERTSVDFLVDGKSLLQQVIEHGSLGGDLMGCFVEGEDDFNRPAREQLLMRANAGLDSGRTAIYVCPECGDLACGVLAVRISREGGAVVWKDFAYENGYEEPLPLDGLEEFRFDDEAYVLLIERAYGAVTA